MEWHHKPPKFEGVDEKFIIHVPGKTDYWRITMHGFIKDDAPFYYRKVEGDFVATVKLTAHYKDLYDQAGLMVRLDANTWLKCGVEYYDEKQQASTVITRDFSDWSIVPLDENPKSVWIRAKRTGACIETYCSLDGEDFVLIRQGHLTNQPQLMVGIYAAAPTGDGFQVSFENFDVKQQEHMSPSGLFPL
jgi:regulation of enolase protein 1 (concanavalin A-like superfamily)